MGLVHSNSKQTLDESPQVLCVGLGGRKRRKRIRNNNTHREKENKKPRSNPESECSEEERDIAPPLHRTLEKCSYLEMFFRVYSDIAIQGFLWMDSCFVLADNYLLSMVYAYFRRAGLAHDEYTRLNFFAALYLAHDMVEDNEDLKLGIYPWVYGAGWKHLIKDFHRERDSFLRRMNFRVAVGKRTCDEIMKLFTSHPICNRVRKVSHSGTVQFEGSVYVKNNMGSVSCAFCSKERKDAALISRSIRNKGNDLDDSFGSCGKTILSVADVGLTEV